MSGVFARAAARPFSAAVVLTKPTAAASPFAPALRRFATARPTPSSSSSFSSSASSAASRTSKTQPRFSSAFYAAAFFRRAGQSGAGRRFQSGTATGPQPSWFQRMWDSPVGLKTVHFWAPIMKWVLVLAGVSDFARPAEKLSITQNIALTATGLIWTRWCLIIKPRNVLLAAVNFFLGIVGVIQCSRIALFRWNGGQPAVEPAGEAAVETK